MSRRYERSVVEWIGMTQRSMGSLEDIVNVISNRFKPELLPPLNTAAHAYVAKFIREQAHKQFDSTLRPALEVVLNAIDARPEDAPDVYTIQLSLSKNKYTVTDNGTGMTLRNLLTYLITPVNTEKDGVGDFGRYGVGFLGTFWYLLNQPKRARISLRTRAEGDQAYQVDFFAHSERAEDLRMRIKPLGERGPIGTKLAMHFTHSTPQLQEYLFKHLKNIQPYLAQIRLERKRQATTLRKAATRLFRPVIDRVSINEPDPSWHVDSVVITREDRRYAQPVAIRVQPAEAGHINLTAQGVTVLSQEIRSPVQFTVIYPPATRLVEGRNEFKIDENFERCTSVAIRLLERYATSHADSPAALTTICQLLPELAQVLKRPRLHDLPSFDFLSETVLAPVQYALTAAEAEPWRAFLGPTLSKTYCVLSAEQRPAWEGRMQSHADFKTMLLQSSRRYAELDFVDACRMQKGVPPTLEPLGRLLGWTKVRAVYLVPLTDSGKAPLTLVQDDLLINTNHPWVRSSQTDIAGYGLAQLLYLRHAPQISNQQHAVPLNPTTEGGLVERSMFGGKYATLGPRNRLSERWSIL